jgi:hypothetical protein
VPLAIVVASGLPLSLIVFYRVQSPTCYEGDMIRSGYVFSHQGENMVVTGQIQVYCLIREN